MSEVRSRYEAFRQAQAAVVVDLCMGETEIDAADDAMLELDSRFADVTQGEHLDAARKEQDAASFDGTRQTWRRLRMALEEAVLERETRSRQVELRRALARGAGPEDAAERREEIFALRAQRLAALGYATALDHARARRPGVDIEVWLAAAARLLEATEPVYRDALGEQLGALGLRRGGPAPPALEAFERRAAFDELFPAANLAACLDFTTERMGLRLGATQGVVVASGQRTACVASCVPGRVALVCGPGSGAAAYEAAFRSAGQALAAAYCSADLPVEYRLDPDPAVTRAWGALLGDRLLDPAWIETGPAAARADAFVRQARLLGLLRLRAAASRLPAEVELAGLAPAADPRRLAGDVSGALGEALGLEFDPATYLTLASPTLAALDELRGACLAWQLGEQFRQRFGQRFWTVRGAGDLLKEVWNTGATYGAEALADQLELGDLSVDVLIEATLAA